MEIKISRYRIVIARKSRPTSFVEAAKLTNTFFQRIALLDDLFKEIILVNASSNKNLLLNYQDYEYDAETLGEIYFKKFKYWLKKMYPNEKHDKYSTKHYGILVMLVTIGKPLENISFTFNLGNNNSLDSISIVFPPKDFVRDFDWYKKLLETAIDVFEPDYACLYPTIMDLKLEPPRPCGGWISYFSDKISLPQNIFDGYVPIDFGNKTMYAIEDNHKIQKDENQFEKLRIMVEKFKELDKSKIENVFY